MANQPPNPENARSASGITVTLSSQLIAGALAILAIDGAVITWVLSNLSPSAWFVGLTVAAFVTLLLSCVCGGVGIDQLEDLVYSGGWPAINNNAGSSYRFSLRAQTVLLALGVILFSLSLLQLGSPKPDVQTSTTRDMHAISQAQKAIARDLHTLVTGQRTDIAQLRQTVHSLQNDVQRLQRLVAVRTHR